MAMSGQASFFVRIVRAFLLENQIIDVIDAVITAKKKYILLHN